MKRNHTMMQFFEWHVEADGKHWQRLIQQAPELKRKGIDALWLPPATKGQSPEDTGYGVYDLYDLGEFDQKGAIRTKYGTKDELLQAIAVCAKHGLSVYADLVMNHKAGADETERFKVVEVNPHNRNEVISKPFDIEGWTKFTFQGRGHRYSSFTWNFEHFNGTDYDHSRDKKGIYRILGKNKRWNEHVDDEFGNYDYLMFANIDYDNPAVRTEMIQWGTWMLDTLHCNGFRLDAIKHINHDFIREFATEMIKQRGRDFYIVGEFWKPDVKSCQKFLEAVNYTIDLFDVALHYKLHRASLAGSSFDLSTIFKDTLVNSHPLNSVTFVDNHDSQPNEALESWVADSFKQSAYALILLRKDGYPCVFYGDYYGIGGGQPVNGKQAQIAPLLYARYEKAYGEQHDYFDHPNMIGWVRLGVPEISNSGTAVVVSNGKDGQKRMHVGAHRAGEVWIDLTGNRHDLVHVDPSGWADFPVNGRSVSVWALNE